MSDVLDVSTAGDGFNRSDVRKHVGSGIRVRLRAFELR